MIRYAFTVILILIFSPIILFLFLFVYFYLLFKIKKPIFFIQERSGYKGRPFNIIKFRTMALNKNNKKETFEKEKLRVLETTKWIRKSRLDELPQILNILKGDIVLVGPRPLLMDYLNLYTEDEKKRLSVPPGLTGWAQINDKNNYSWKEKFQMDIWYVDNRSLILDLKIIYKTFFFLKRSFFNENKNEDIITERYNGKN